MYVNLKFGQRKDRYMYSIRIASTLFSGNIPEQDEYVMSSILMSSEIGRDFSELLDLMISLSLKLNEKSVLNTYKKLYDFSKKYTMEEYLHFVDKAMFRAENIEYRKLCGACISNNQSLVSLIDIFYSDGILSYYGKTTSFESVDSSIRGGNYFDLIAMLMGVAQYTRNRSFSNINANKQIINSKQLLTKSEFSTAKYMFNYEIISATDTFSDDELINRIIFISINIAALTLRAHMNSSKLFYPGIRGAVASYEREDFNSNIQEKANYDMNIRTFVTTQPSGLFTKRNVLLREKGVIIKPINGENLYDTVASMFIKEEHIHEMDIHNIIVEQLLVDETGFSSNYIVIDINDYTSLARQLLFGIEIPLLYLLFTVCRLDHKVIIDNCVDYLRTEDGASEEDLELLRNELNKSVSDTLNKFSELYYFEEPGSWNYAEVTSNKTKKSSNKEVIGSMLVDVGNYTRRLPAGQVASERARQMAKDYLIDLEDNKTFVKEFTKEIKIKV